jgi:D-xylose transport system substrate-binding protein
LSFDNLRVGEAQARYAVDHLPKDRTINIVRIYGAPTDNNAKMFKQGQDGVLLPLIAAGKVHVNFEDWATDWRPDVAKKIMNAALTKSGSAIDAVIVTNDGTAGGAIQALREEGLAGKVLVTGQDADLAACQRIMRGTQAMTVYKPVKKLSTLAAETAVAVVRGQPVTTSATVDNGARAVPTIYEAVISVDRSNLMQTVAADGFHSAAEIK